MFSFLSIINEGFFFSRNSAVDFNFPARRGTGIARHLTHCSSDTIDLINQLCVYDPDHRISAAQALRHPYFDAIR
jgi:serine/threonine protein kinase